MSSVCHVVGGPGGNSAWCHDQMEKDKHHLILLMCSRGNPNRQTSTERQKEFLASVLTLRPIGGYQKEGDKGGPMEALGLTEDE